MQHILHMLQQNELQKASISIQKHSKATGILKKKREFMFDVTCVHITVLCTYHHKIATK